MVYLVSMNEKVEAWVLEWKPLHESGCIVGLYSTEALAESNKKEQVEAGNMGTARELVITRYTVDE